MGLVTRAALEAGFGVFVILVCVIIEQFAVIERYSLRSRIPGILMNIAGASLSVGLIWPIGLLWGALGIAPLITLPLWNWLQPLGWVAYPIQFLLLVLIADFLAYWRHRAEHSWFWPIHAVHHSPTELHAANDIGHPVQIWFSIVFISLPMSLIRIDGPATPFVIGFVVTLLSYYIHSPIDVHFGPLRNVLVDNRFHRIHHSIEPRHFDRNFGICFSMWDRWFGTAYEPAEGEWPAVGLAEVPAPRTVFEFLTLPLAYLPGRKAPDARAGEALTPHGKCQIADG